MKMKSYVFGITLLLGSRLLSAQAPDPLLERLRRAELATSLTREGVGPFYLKIDVQLYDAKGKPSENGTIEEWWAGDSTEKTVYATPSYTATQVRKGDEIFRSAGASYPPSLLKLLLDQVIRPMPSAASIQDSKASLSTVKAGAVPMECVLLRLHNDPDGLPPDYCFDPGKDSLRITFQYGNRVTIRNRIGTFQQKQVPMDVTVRLGDLMSATGHISALVNRPVPESDISTDGLTEKSFWVSPLGMKGKAIREVPPIYPEEAKRQHISGTVVLYVVVGTDGHVYNPSVVSSPSEILSYAAREAVKQYIFTPYEVDGTAQKIEVMIAVNFTFGQR